ncbi:MAG TPA: AEC family transporter [Candidatus Enterenecus stercoripullorum]|nr:AEC family transporter [Candidatus Enterenecus stercoripullorum]
MLERIWESVQVVGGSVLTLFLLMAVGFVLGKWGLLTGQTLSQMSQLLLRVVTPAIIIDSFAMERTSALDRQLLTAGAALAGTYALYMLLSTVMFRRRDPDERGILRFASIYGNKGFMGLPLIQAALGSQATMVAALALAVFNVVIWTHGIAIIGGREYLSVGKAICNPASLGFAAALVMFLTGLRLPGPAEAAVGYLADLNTPLAMVVIGAQMAAVDLPALVGDRRLYQVCALKLLVIPAVTMLALLPFHVDGTVFITLAILSGCPVAGATSLFSQAMGKDTGLAARLVSLSTLLCIFTLPLVAVVAGQVAGV